jgi:hypothetical protein
MAQHAPLVAVDRAPLGTICIDRQPRSQPQWRSEPLPGCWVRSGRVGSGAASQALQAGLPPVLEADSIDRAAATMVAGTNSRLAQAHISGGTTKSGVTLDDLSQPVHSGARCVVERHSRYVMLVKVANKDTESVVSALIKQSQRLPSELYRSLMG